MKNKKMTLGDRMKKYENINRNKLIPNIPVIIRLDGKAFHSFTKGFDRPFDNILIAAMDMTARNLCKNIMGCKIAYVQSDEITLLLTDFDNIDTQMWFDGNIQKIVSVAASMATMEFNRAFELYSYGVNKYFSKAGKAMFDARVFQVPIYEVVNNFIWRQQDATRNSIQLVGQDNFSHKQLHKKSCNDIQDMLMLEKGINWNDFPTNVKRGRCIVKETYTIERESMDEKEKDVERTRWIVDNEIPIFTQDRDYINNLMKFD